MFLQCFCKHLSNSPVFPINTGLLDKMLVEYRGVEPLTFRLPV